jgi:hypothetical protein
MKKIPELMFAMLAIAAIAYGADNSLGTWKYNTTKSKQNPGLAPITSLTSTYEAIDGGVRITIKGERADGLKIDNVTTVKYDGKEVPVTGTGIAWDTVAYRQIDANTVTIERSKKGGKYHASVRDAVSADGKTLTQSARGTGADGKAFTTVGVWDRQ